MQVVSHSLATASDGSPPVRTEARSASDDWRRELERAHAGGWFHGPLPDPQPAIAEAAASPVVAHHGHTAAENAAAGGALPKVRVPLQMLDQVQVSQLQRSSFQRVELAPRAPAMLVLDGWRNAHLPPAERTGSPNAVPSAPEQLQVADGHIRMEPMAASMGSISPSKREIHPGHGAPRLHIEESDSRASVWLGLDGDGATVAARAAAILVELRRSLAATGQRLTALVCNGTTFYTAPGQERPGPVHSTKEPPWQ